MSQAVSVSSQLQVKKSHFKLSNNEFLISEIIIPHANRSRPCR